MSVGKASPKVTDDAVIMAKIADGDTIVPMARTLAIDAPNQLDVIIETGNILACRQCSSTVCIHVLETMRLHLDADCQDLWGSSVNVPVFAKPLLEATLTIESVTNAATFRKYYWSGDQLGFLLPGEGRMALRSTLVNHLAALFYDPEIGCTNRYHAGPSYLWRGKHRFDVNSSLKQVVLDAHAMKTQGQCRGCLDEGTDDLVPKAWN